MFNATFDDILDRCLERIEAGESIESCLSDFPQYAEELKGSLEMACRLQRLPIEKPSLAADFFFQHRLEQAKPAPTPKIQRFTKRFVLPSFKNLWTVSLEFGFVAAIVAIISFVFISHADRLSNEPATLQIAKETLTYADLSNLDYDAALVGNINLQDGSYPLVSKDYAGNHHEIELDKLIAVGDLDDDGWDDAAALLYWRDESVTPLWTLVIVRNDQGKPENVASLFIGPNLIVDQLEIIDQLVHITVIDSYGNSYTKIYKLDRADLVLLDERAQINPLNNRFGGDGSVLRIGDPQNSIITTSLLKDLSYPIEGSAISFKDGTFYGEYFTTRVIDSQQRSGDLTADNLEEDSVVVILTQTTSNADSIYYLSVETEWDAEALPITSISTDGEASELITADSYGHHLKLQSIEIENGAITVEVSTQGKNRLADGKMVETIYEFNLIDNEFVPLANH